MTNCFGRHDDAATPSEGADARAARERVERDAPNDERARSIACLAHDFNNLLTVVMGNLSALQLRIDADLAERYADPAMRACRRGADIARRLTDLALRGEAAPSGVGDGARVCLQTPEAARDDRDGAERPERRELVLIVAGDDDARAARRRELVEEGFGVLEARDAREAQALLAAVHEIGAVVLDAPPGDATGCAIADRTRDVRPDVAIVLIARASDPPAIAGRGTEGAVVLMAPVTRAELVRAIARGRAAPAPKTW